MNGTSVANAPVVPPEQAFAPSYPARGTHDPRRKSPVLAGFLSLVPGLGQVYAGYYVRGFVHSIVVGSILSILAGEVMERGGTPLLSLFLVFFWLYNVIDAARKASLVNLALEGIGTMELPEDFPTPRLQGSIAAGVVLIALGGIFLSNTLFGASLLWLQDWWPAFPILFGIYLVARGIRERSKG